MLPSGVGGRGRDQKFCGSDGISYLIPIVHVFILSFLKKHLEASFHFSVYFLERQIARVFSDTGVGFPTAELKEEVACDLRSNFEKQDSACVSV